LSISKNSGVGVVDYRAAGKLADRARAGPRGLPGEVLARLWQDKLALLGLVIIPPLPAGGAPADDLPGSLHHDGGAGLQPAGRRLKGRPGPAGDYQALKNRGRTGCPFLF